MDLQIRKWISRHFPLRHKHWTRERQRREWLLFVTSTCVRSARCARYYYVVCILIELLKWNQLSNQVSIVVAHFSYSIVVVFFFAFRCFFCASSIHRYTTSDRLSYTRIDDQCNADCDLLESTIDLREFYESGFFYCLLFLSKMKARRWKLERKIGKSFSLKWFMEL